MFDHERPSKRKSNSRTRTNILIGLGFSAAFIMGLSKTELGKLFYEEYLKPNGFRAPKKPVYDSSGKVEYNTESPSTDQTTRWTERGDGRQVTRKGGADEQSNPRSPWDDDDDLPGGAVSGDGAFGPGGVESEFDALPFAVVLTVVAVLGVVYFASRSTRLQFA